MNNYLKLLILITLIFPVALLSSSSATSREELKICKQGLKSCQYLIKNKTRYRQCMIEKCSSYYKNQENRDILDTRQRTKQKDRGTTSRLMSRTKSLEKIQMCSYGKRKCDVLTKTNQAYYWMCMKNECKNPTKDNATPNCQEGQRQCTEASTQYSKCVNFVCKGNNKGKSCDEGKKMCEHAKKEYWHCVYKQCLGDVDIYFDYPIQKNKRIIAVDEKGNSKIIRHDKNKIELGGVHPEYRKPPDGINPDEWARDVPSEFLLTGNPSSYMRCAMPTAVMKCGSNDARSCGCTDGTVPIFLRGAPKKIDTTDW